jgi:isopentenyldiphosphate isomerase
MNPHALSQAQSADELFAVMHPPKDDFDVDRDRPTPTGRTKRRADVHADGDWHRSAHVWIVDAIERRVVVQRRSARKDTFPNRWDISAAGHVDASTSDSRETATSELAEELGVVLDDSSALKFQFTCPAEQHDAGGCNCFEDVYFLEWNVDEQGESFAVGEAEVTATDWIAICELESALNAGDERYVPRVDAYKRVFFPRLRAFCESSNRRT